MQYELEGAETLNIEEIISLRDTLILFSKEKNTKNNVDVWVDVKADKVFTNNKTTLRLYNLMIDFKKGEIE